MSRVDDAAAVLRRRASVLARPLTKADHTPTSDVLVVTVAGRSLGLDGRHVSQVLPGDGLCRLPHGSGALTALVPARGGTVPVADLGVLLGATAEDSRAYVVLLEGDAPPVGVLVDAVHEMRPVADSDVRPAPVTSGDGALETGITPDGLVLLDLARLLADPRLHPRSSSDTPTSPAPPQENHVQDDHR